MTDPGEPAPGFTLPGTAGETVETYDLAEFTADGATVLVFYPFDFSPVCTEVLCDFRDAEWLSFTEGVDVLGVTRDSCYAHKAFIDAYDIPFPLLSDSAGRVIEAYDLAYDEFDGHETVPKRALVTIDDSQSVRYRWETDDGYESPDLDELRECVISLAPEGS